ncbi:MAG: hypothetical protein R3D05_02065 [Dongiaceae bacterium]
MGAIHNAVAVAALACTSMPAFADDLLKWAEVGAWPVIVDRTLGNGCFTYMTYDTGTMLRVGFTRLTSQGYMLIANNAWSSVEIGRRYDVTLKFGKAPPWNDEATAINLNGTISLWMSFSNVDVIVDFMQEEDVAIWYNGRRVDSVSLNGGYAAFSEVLRCQEVMNALPAPSAFSGDAIPEQIKPVGNIFAM